MLGVFLDLQTVDRRDLDLGELRNVLPQWRFYEATMPEQVIERLQGASVVVSNKVRLGRAVFEQCPSLKLICVAATGTNNVDLPAAAEYGVQVCNVRGYSTPSVVQHVFAMLLALTTSQPQYQQAVRQGNWSRSPMFCLLDYPIEELAGKTLGIVGYGALGSAVARVAEAFGMHVLIAGRPGGALSPGRVPLQVLLPQVDVLSLHCPLTDQTLGLIGARELTSMRQGAIVINTARGGIVDEQALADALRRGHLAGAGVDVMASEPPPCDAPLLARDIPNLIVTPHTAWASRQSRQRLVNELAENIRCYLIGQIRSQVT